MRQASQVQLDGSRQSIYNEHKYNNNNNNKNNTVHNYDEEY